MGAVDAEPGMTETVYERLGVVPAINAKGLYTDLGGSSMSPRVMTAVAEANGRFAEMTDLLDRAGEAVAALLHTEGARVTPGASAAIMLSLAACMTGTDGARMEQLPDTTGMKGNVVIQRGHRYKYDRMVRMTGAKLVEAGTDDGTTSSELTDAIGDGTVAAILFPAHLDGLNGTVPLADSAAIAHQAGVPIVVDAAYLNYPVDVMRSFTESGADLAIFSAKYFGGPNAGGFVCGDGRLIEAIAGVDFTRFESGDYLIFGRPFKLDRWTVVAVVEALTEWIEMGHDARFEHYARLVETIERGTSDASWVSASRMNFTMEEDVVPGPTNCLVVRLDPADGHVSATELDRRLRSRRPAILTHLRGDELIFDVEAVSDDDAVLIAGALQEELGRAAGRNGTPAGVAGQERALGGGR
jgi:L-seryl-tRNA(Ser) seleniumtransferase